MNEPEKEIYSLKQSRDNYKRLYEKEQALVNGKAAMRETDRTRLIEMRDFIDELLARWEGIS